MMGWAFVNNRLYIVDATVRLRKDLSKLNEKPRGPFLESPGNLSGP